MKDVIFWGNELKTSLRDVEQTKMESYVEYKLEHGTVIGWTLHRDDYVHVVRAFLSKGAVFPLHDHELSFESLILYRGNVDVIYENSIGEQQKSPMAVGKPAYFKKGQDHKLIAREDSWVISAWVPPDKDVQ